MDEWIRVNKMEINVKKALEEYKNEQYCDPCRFTGKQIIAKGFCKTCDGCLCSDCIKAHRKSRETKLHVISNVNKMADTKSLRNLEHCEKHKCIIESFCEEHDSVCCRECISKEHQDCRRLVPLQRASSGVHGNSEMKQVSTDLEHLIYNFEKRVKDEKESLHRVDAQGKSMGDAVKKFRVEINKLIDKIEMSMYLKRDEVVKDEKKILNDRVSLCQKAIPNLRKAEETINKITIKTEEQLAFIAMKNVKHMVAKYEEVHSELVDTQGTFSLKFLPNKDLVTALDSFGSINVKSTLRPVGSTGENGFQEQEKLVLHKEINVRAPDDTTASVVTGCAFMSDGRLVLADEANQSIKLFDEDLAFLHSCKTHSAPWDIAAISDSEIAVRNSFAETDKDTNKILIVKVDKNSLKHERQFNIEGRPRAIRFSSPHLYIACSEGKKAHILVLEGEKVVRTLRPKPGVLSQPQYIAVSSSAEIVWISDFYNGIIALDMKGSVLFRLTDSHVSEYGGITIDVYDDVYICAGKPYGIYKVSQDCKDLKSLMVWENETVDPQAIVYNCIDEYFLVSSCNSDTAFIFKFIK